MQRKKIVEPPKVGTITLRQAREAAKAVKLAKLARIGTSPKLAAGKNPSKSLIKRYLGHFGDGRPVAVPEKTSGVGNREKVK